MVIKPQAFETAGKVNKYIIPSPSWNAVWAAGVALLISPPLALALSQGAKAGRATARSHLHSVRSTSLVFESDISFICCKGCTYLRTTTFIQIFNFSKLVVYKFCMQSKMYDTSTQSEGLWWIKMRNKCNFPRNGNWCRNCACVSTCASNRGGSSVSHNLYINCSAVGFIMFSSVLPEKSRIS